MMSKIVQLDPARRNQPRDYQLDMLKAAILQIRALRAEIAAMKKMIQPQPFCDGLEK